MTLSRTVVNDVIEKGISAFTDDALADERYVGGESIVRQRIRSVMCAPMRTTDTILGVLYVDSQQAKEFSEAELELLAAVGNQAGIAMHRARLMAEVERLFLDVMKAIASIIDAKDGYTHKHSERVAAFGVRLAQQLGFDADSRSVVELSGLLHDVGKIGVPDAILNKPGKLTEAEFTEMKMHPLHGARILSNIQSQKVVNLIPGVKYHHERWDGNGYPEGLKGEEIPLLGRLLGVADFLDALTSDRSYRKGLTLEEALADGGGARGQGVRPGRGQGGGGAARERTAGAADARRIRKRSRVFRSPRSPGGHQGHQARRMNRLLAVSDSGRRPDARARRFTITGGSNRNRHSSARPPIAANTPAHSLPPRRDAQRNRLDDQHGDAARDGRLQRCEQQAAIALGQLVDDECGDDERGVGRNARARRRCRGGPRPPAPTRGR